MKLSTDKEIFEAGMKAFENSEFAYKPPTKTQEEIDEQIKKEDAIWKKWCETHKLVDVPIFFGIEKIKGTVK